jgi:hypothetical protein
MPSIGDLVANLEVDHADALTKIDVLTAANDALIDTVSAIAAEKAVLEARVAELSARADTMYAMAEKVAGGALDMLKAARMPADTPPDVIPFAPKPKTNTIALFAESPLAERTLKPITPAADNGPWLVPPKATNSLAVPINEPASVVDRIKQRFLPAVSFTRRPDVIGDGEPGGLPMFLRRDTVFARKAAAA